MDKGDEMSVFTDVLNFHRKFGCFIAEKPSIQDKKRKKLRIALIQEEFDELLDAVKKKNIVKIADALADIQYVVNGMAIAYGINLDEVHKEVHASNMRKVGGKIRPDGKVLKPEGWKSPQIEEILEKQLSLLNNKKV